MYYTDNEIAGLSFSCGAEVDKLDTHGLSCRFSKCRHSRHAAINNCIKQSLDCAKVPSNYSSLEAGKDPGVGCPMS